MPASMHVIHSATYTGTCARATKSYMLASDLTVHTAIYVNLEPDLRLVTLINLLQRSMPLLTIPTLV